MDPHCSSSRPIMRLAPVFILETNNCQTNNKCLPKFVQTDNPSSSIKTANGKCFPRQVDQTAVKLLTVSLPQNKIAILSV